ncbi:nitroreductase [Billgrantia desiderata]|uniref:Nitroreductase n=1 Tax=Billgrantia desiderata TaxID=52021 RepID=A0ABS9BBN3_9GAMM|nr:nitroreductase [Halomonas desiderata]MCE8044699.1 nitroreductase [Halomonas desiderata]MCE8049273.1 nitroreductase [Halomonas desiderata]SEG24433.1 Nitroreductase [Halomonas desiderata]
MHVDDAIRSRKSVRRFLPDPVSRDTLAHIIEVAGRAPSGNNIQPWQVHVVAGEALHRLSAAILAAFDSGEEHQPEYTYYPTQWFEPYRERRQRCGYGLYETLGIRREDKARRHEQMRRNFLFFDAPVAMIVTIDRRLETGSYMDAGMLIQSLMTAARGQGLHTCAQAALAWYHRIIRAQLGLADSELVLCAIAVGHEAPEAPENHFITEREPVENVATFHGFETD